MDEIVILRAVRVPRGTFQAAPAGPDWPGDRRGGALEATAMVVERID